MAPSERLGGALALAVGIVRDMRTVWSASQEPGYRSGNFREIKEQDVDATIPTTQKSGNHFAMRQSSIIQQKARVSLRLLWLSRWRLCSQLGWLGKEN